MACAWIGCPTSGDHVAWFAWHGAGMEDGHIHHHVDAPIAPFCARTIVM